MSQPMADPKPTWAEARAKVWHQPGHRAAWTHDDPGDSCTSATAAHRTYSTAVNCERTSQLTAWRRRIGQEPGVMCVQCHATSAVESCFVHGKSTDPECPKDGE